MRLQNHKTDESKQAQSVYIKNYWDIYTTVNQWWPSASWFIF